MTDRELMQQALEALNSCCTQQTKMWFDNLLVYDAIAVLRERLSQPEQEPVAWRYRAPVEDEHWVWNYATYMDDPQNRRWCEALYTTPPQRPWVGLTDEEIHDAFQNSSRRSIYQAIENSLKEKNT